MIDRIKGIINVEWEKIKPIQPDDVKINTNINALKKSLKNHGFSLPFAVWKDDNVIYCVDGHTRVKALKELKHEGEDVPDKLKAFEIEANDRKEAVKILVEVFNQKHNQFDNEVLINWLEVENVEVKDLEAVNIMGGFSADDFGEDFNLPDGDKPPFQQMTFTLADEQEKQKKNAIADIKQTEEYKYAETMGNENSNGNALYLIIMQWAEQRK